MDLKNELKYHIIGTVLVIAITMFFINQYSVTQSLQYANSNLPVISNGTILTPEEVAKHNTVSDCWLIINNNVYAVTSYMQIHPGGAQIIQFFCGKDGTIAYQTKDGRGSHSKKAYDVLAKLLIGPLNGKQIISVSAVQQNTLLIPIKSKKNDND
ncbi:MAG: cytochrome b5-like heme/steroid binding domain-containing protein [bacterium]|nr:cytochrome b5-like heme/steroid binding domain-containing protein [bacterium]